jgi:hypothetical protein
LHVIFPTDQTSLLVNGAAGASTERRQRPQGVRQLEQAFGRCALSRFLGGTVMNEVIWVATRFTY